MSTNKPVLDCLDIFEKQLQEFEKFVKQINKKSHIR